MSTFSYAQAAKGNSGTTAPAKTPSEPEKTETPVVEQTSTETTTETAPAPAESEAPQKSEKAVVEEKDDDFTTVTNKHAAKSKALNSRTSSPNVRPGSKSRKTKEEDSSNTANGTADATEKQASTDGQTEKAEGAAEKSTEKSEDAEKNTPPKELKAAPLPSVNIWQQRREAQDLKVKVVPKSAATGKAASTKAASNADESQQDSSKASKKKGTDGASENKDRKKAEGGKARDAEDSTAWPTPQVAIVEEKKKTQEKTDKSPVIRPHGKEKWTPVPYVPTAVFNTPLPSAGGGGNGGGGGRGGRRATRGGRDGGRGAHGNGAAGVDKTASGQAAQGAKQASGERGRQESGTGRAASLPAQSRRSTSTDAGAAADARKATQATERGRGPRNGDENINGKQVNGGENVPRAQREGKAFGRNQDPRQKGGNLAVDPQAAARSNDRRFEAGSKSADPAGFSDFSRERGEFRSERGGRANRGRGGPYSSFGGQNAQFGNPAMNSFAGNKPFGFNDRQRSQQHAMPNGAQQPNRMPLRSPSLPNSGNVYGVYQYPGDINTMYGYQAVNPAPMSAIPYQQYMEPYALLNLLSMQLEYYFSVDNMCKDMFLRKQMDSQGFVPLHVLASFKRVKSLTEDFELLRHVARQLRTVEYHTSEDGVDHLRPREKWQQWVLPVDQREPAAQHEGAAPIPKSDENAPINPQPESAINGSAPQFVPNGTAKTSLSSTAPEFMPSVPPTAGSEITNVGYPMDSPLSPEDLPASFVPFPWDDPNVDIDPARGLDSRSEPPLPSDLVPAAGPMSFDKKPNPFHASGAAHTVESSFVESRHPEPNSSGGRRPFTDTLNYVPNSFDSSFNGRGRSVARRSSIENSASYESWSSLLAQNFDFNLYNDFRRSALDDLLTRHVDHGFNALVEFYRKSLLTHRNMPDRVMMDMVSLSQRGPDFHTIIFNTINDALASGNMKMINRRKVNKYFNTQHGKTPEEKLSC
ncbi:unnamed protein product [Penicillium olsonii]|nr:unnamed protein product [Penicillium olsonii]